MPTNQRDLTPPAEGYRFDGRVAVVTGGGRGIGRAHALLLAERGATVVVNDVGSTKEGDASTETPADEVVNEIIAAGGKAIADTNDMGSEAGCHALIDATIKEYGRIDILVNNAGISRWARFPDADAENLERTLDVHVRGSWHTTRAAWPHMVKQGYGRVVMTTSTGVFGLADNLAYATAKGAIIGMMRSLSQAGAEHGITVNCLAPNAVTRPGTAKNTPNLKAIMPAMPDPSAMDTAMVSPILAVLAHETCDVTGEIYLSGAGRFSRILLAATDGYVHQGDDLPTAEEVAEHWQQINDDSDFYVPASLPAWTERYLSHVSG